MMFIVIILKIFQWFFFFNTSFIFRNIWIRYWLPVNKHFEPKYILFVKDGIYFLVNSEKIIFLKSRYIIQHYIIQHYIIQCVERISVIICMLIIVKSLERHIILKLFGSNKTKRYTISKNVTYVELYIFLFE